MKSLIKLEVHIVRVRMILTMLRVQIKFDVKKAMIDEGFPKRKQSINDVDVLLVVFLRKIVTRDTKWKNTKSF